jgi:hypothetical protein
MVLFLLSLLPENGAVSLVVAPGKWCLTQDTLQACQQMLSNEAAHYQRTPQMIYCRIFGLQSIGPYVPSST